MILEQVEDGIAKITGKRKGKGALYDYEDLRDRVIRWMGSRAGEKFSGEALCNEFPELNSISSVAMFMKKPINDGRVQSERTGVPRSAFYFVPKA